MMRSRLFGAAVLAVAGGAAAWAQIPPGDLLVDFEAFTTGPAGAACDPGLTGGGGPVDWQIVADATAPAGANVLTELSGDRTGSRFPLCLFPGFSAANVEVAVAFRPVAGTVDQAAGLIVRAVDPDNYYIARANALEANVRLYKVENGLRTQLAGTSIPIATGEWRTLGMRIVGDRVEVLLDGVVLFETTDQTFGASGAVGVWTKADSLTHFDRFSALALP